MNYPVLCGTPMAQNWPSITKLKPQLRLRYTAMCCVLKLVFHGPAFMRCSCCPHRQTERDATKGVSMCKPSKIYRTTQLCFFILGTPFAHLVLYLTKLQVMRCKVTNKEVVSVTKGRLACNREHGAIGNPFGCQVHHSITNPHDMGTTVKHRAFPRIRHQCMAWSPRVRTRSPPKGTTR